MKKIDEIILIDDYKLDFNDLTESSPSKIINIYNGENFFIKKTVSRKNAYSKLPFMKAHIQQYLGYKVKGSPASEHIRIKGKDGNLLFLIVPFEIIKDKAIQDIEIGSGFNKAKRIKRYYKNKKDNIR